MIDLLAVANTLRAGLESAPLFVGFQSPSDPSTHEPRAARRALRIKGWSITAAAAQFGVRREHLSQVLNGHRQSRRLLREIATLPEHPDAH